MVGLKFYLKELDRTILPEKTRRDMLRLDMNESVSGLPEEFVKKILSRVDSPFIAMYPEYVELTKKVAQHNKLDAENICLSNGSDAAIKYIFDAYILTQDKVLLTDPTFAMYPVYCRMFDAVPLLVEYKPDFKFPFDAFMDRLLHDTVRMAVVVNPNNPTGSALKKDELMTIIETAQDKDVLIIVDEAYFYFYPETIITEVKQHKNLIVLRTFSKLCAMASLRLGYAAAYSEIIENLRKVKPTYDVNGLAALFAEGLLDRPDIIQGLIKSTNEGREFLTKRLSEEGIEFKDSCANFVLIKCNGRSDEIISRLKESNILVGGNFKQDLLKDYIRITVADKFIMDEFWRSFLSIWRYPK